MGADGPSGTSGGSADATRAQARATAARAAVAELETGMTIGFGSGRAVAAVIDLAARRWPSGPPLLAVVASSATDSQARAAGFAVVSLDELDLKRSGLHDGDVASATLLDLVIDGADEVDPRLDLIKGGGGALLREKLVARAARRFLIVVEDDKVVTRLGEHHALPVEVVRFAWRATRRSLLELVPAARLRRGGDGQAFVTDEGHFILDCTLEGDRTPEVDRAPEGDRELEGDRTLESRREESGGEGLAALAAALKALPGVVDHGLFLGMADEVVVGHADGSIERRLWGVR
jgi:ribose 5-phosphate isomerase A